jgi:hypothetical protein
MIVENISEEKIVKKNTEGVYSLSVPSYLLTMSALPLVCKQQGISYDVGEREIRP